jgi:AraC-like DNA-binding protein
MAADLMKMGFGNVSEVAMEVGFSNPSYFSKMFRRSYNIAPADYLKSCNTSRSPSEFTSGNNL